VYNVKIKKFKKNKSNEKSQITNNATLNNQMGVDNIVTRMKSNKRKRNNTYNQTRKKSHKSQTQTSCKIKILYILIYIHILYI